MRVLFRLRAPWLTVCLWALAAWALGAGQARADGHALWALHGKRNTVYVLGSIHTLRAGDYPLPAAVLDAYRNAKSLVMEIDPGELDAPEVQSEMLASAALPDGKTLAQVMGAERYARAAELARGLGFDLATFERFAPWFVAESISQLQLAQLGFDPQSGVEMYFLGRARTDGKPVAGLETAHDQLMLFESMPLKTQARYLISSLEQARDLPQEVDEMVRAWRRGDLGWFETELKSDLGSDPEVYQSLLLARNRQWIARIERLLDDDENYLVIVGTAHLVGRGSVIDLLEKDGVSAARL